MYNEDEKNYEGVHREIMDKGFRLKFQREHPTYRPTCCGQEDFIVLLDQRKYVCKHCSQMYDIDVWIENWGPNK